MNGFCFHHMNPSASQELPPPTCLLGSFLLLGPHFHHTRRFPSTYLRMPLGPGVLGQLPLPQSPFLVRQLCSLPSLTRPVGCLPPQCPQPTPVEVTERAFFMSVNLTKGQTLSTTPPAWNAALLWLLGCSCLSYSFQLPLLTPLLPGPSLSLLSLCPRGAHQHPLSFCMWASMLPPPFSPLAGPLQSVFKADPISAYCFSFPCLNSSLLQTPCAPSLSPRMAVIIFPGLPLPP